MTDFTLFQKPQRYIGNEWNVIKKSHEGRVKICLSYPDLYEVGMSNLGLRILYSLLNDFSGVVCERVFMPALDYASFLQQRREKLTSLETKTSLDEFEVVGFNLNCELNYTNFLHILSLGGIPLKAEQRKEIIVLGGGIANPEPAAEFVDLFFLGEFEEIAPKFIQVLKEYKDKESRLKAFSEIDGFYVPKFYFVELRNNRYVFEKKYSHANSPVKKVYVKDLDHSFVPRNWLVPYTQIIHDRVQVEIARGCPNKCTFCQARELYYPYRQRKISAVSAIIKETYRNSGYEDFSLLALSVSDYSHIEELIDETVDYFQTRKIGLALPSLRVDDIVGRLYKKLIPLKKTSLTLAIEAARSGMRDKMNKRIDIAKLFETAKIIRSLRVRHLKIYFLFGLPEEEDQDLIAIGEFLDSLSKESKLTLNVSVNIFIPKPFSTWNTFPMDEEAVLEKKRKIITGNLPRNENINVSISSSKKSILEAVISRADRRFSSVIYRAYLKGARSDGENGKFRWDVWEEAMKEEKIDYRFYLEAKTENFPWSFIDIESRRLKIED